MLANLQSCMQVTLAGLRNTQSTLVGCLVVLCGIWERMFREKLWTFIISPYLNGNELIIGDLYEAVSHPSSLLPVRQWNFLQPPWGTDVGHTNA